MDFDTDISSEVSDVDPQAVLKSLQNMDDLDAELFGSKGKNETPTRNRQNSLTIKKDETSSKRVSFKSPDIKTDDFDVDDALAGLLSDDDQQQAERKSAFNSNVAQSSILKTERSRKTSDSNESDALFGDEDVGDLFKSLGLDEDKPKVQSKERRKSLPGSLKEPQPLTQSSPSKRSSSRYRFDKDGNLVTEKSPAEDFSFGTYQPSSASTTQRPSRNLRSSAPKKEDNFLDFLDDDTMSSTKPKLNPLPKQTPPARRSRKSDFLELGDEVDLDAIIEVKGSSTAKTSSPSKSTPKPTPKSKTIEEPSGIPATAVSPAMRKSTPSPVTQSSFGVSPTQRKTTSVLLKEKQPFADTSEPSSPTSPQISNSKPVSASDFDFDQLLPTITTQTVAPTIVVTDNIRPVSHAPIANTLRDQSMSTIHNVQSGYQADLEIAKQAYDNRIESLHSAVTDIRTRAEREIEAIKESYDMRMEGLRKQMRDQIQEASGKDVLEQEEIKRLRALHLAALEDTRLDYEDRIKRIKETHVKDIDTLKSSTVYVRNLDKMLERVNEATLQVERLSSKHEATFNNFEQKWSNMATENKRILSGFQTQIEDIQNSTLDMQNSLQQTVSRLEGNMTEISRALREQQYHLQLERNRLESAQTSLENKKRQLLQQVSTQSADAMKAHKEAIELRQFHERDMREDNERMRLREEQLQRSQRVLEEARAVEAQQVSGRERERRKMEEELAKERAAMTEKVEKLAGLEARLKVDKEELDRRQTSLTIAEKRLEKKNDDLEAREEELRITEERASRKLAESAAALDEAKRVEKGQESRLNEIHDNANALARQRLLLAEERKQMIEDRVKYRPGDGSAGIIPVMHSPHLTSTLNPRRNLNLSPKKPDSSPNAALWMFTAQQDRDFLEDEQVYLDALKFSPQRGSQDS